ncbi:MAG TPA: hypothetical protein VKV04_07460 [Verrucomicrobiae bacterium]|nr:hypothetical protein [Verrucomicrobiae bacterium]
MKPSQTIADPEGEIYNLLARESELQRQAQENSKLKERLDAEERELLSADSLNDPKKLNRITQVRIQRQISSDRQLQIQEQLDEIPSLLQQELQGLNSQAEYQLHNQRQKLNHELFKAIAPFFKNRPAEAWEAVNLIVGSTNLGTQLFEPEFRTRRGIIKERPLRSALKELLSLIFTVEKLDPYTENFGRGEHIQSPDELERAELASILSDREPHIYRRLQLGKVTPKGLEPMFTRSEAEKITEARYLYLLSKHPDVAPAESARQELANLLNDRERAIASEMENLKAESSVAPKGEAAEERWLKALRKQAEDVDSRANELRKKISDSKPKRATKAKK